MVTLSKIYTRGGDQGKTSLGSGERVFKSDLRVATYGAVDEANAALGLALLYCEDGDMNGYLITIQNQLFDVGAELCMDPQKNADKHHISAFDESDIQKIESLIDFYNQDLPPLKSFVLPGGTFFAAHLHVARTLVRKAERELVALCLAENCQHDFILQYLNRLSDLLFVLSRYENCQHETEMLWVPKLKRLQ